MFTSLLKYMIRDGCLRWIDGRGRTHIIGDGSKPCCTVRLNRRALDWTLLANPGLAVPEAYMDGVLTIEDGTPFDFFELASRNYRHLEAHPLMRLIQRVDPARRGQHNPLGRARRNVAHHYDLSDELYALFLDSDRQYSCGYFEHADDDIETAQLAKKRHLASKLRLGKGLKTLDIGCGWGGLGLYLARTSGVDVTGLTLSTEQHAVANRRAAEAGLADRVRFRLQDYREETGPYDRIVSVGMFEHVGRRNYAEFFRKAEELLAPDGVMLLHAIGRFESPAPINPFIRKYIFPGADLPALSEVLSAVEPVGLYATDIEILRLHYAETLRHWRARFMARRDEAVRIYDERFCRMWEIYMVICELGFRQQDLMVFQLQLTRSLDALPLTRNYMYEWERAQADKEGAAKGRKQDAA